MSSEHWKDEPEEHDYPAALSYLSLVMDPADAGDVVHQLKKRGEVERYKGKDVLRASGLPILPLTNPHVAADFKKAKDGEKLSPVLLMRGRLDVGAPLLIADGYHRVCASWHIDENADIPCRIV